MWLAGCLGHFQNHGHLGCLSKRTTIPVIIAENPVASNNNHHKAFWSREIKHAWTPGRSQPDVTPSRSRPRFYLKNINQMMPLQALAASTLANCVALPPWSNHFQPEWTTRNNLPEILGQSGWYFTNITHPWRRFPGSRTEPSHLHRVVHRARAASWRFPSAWPFETLSVQRGAISGPGGPEPLARAEGDLKKHHTIGIYWTSLHYSSPKAKCVKDCASTHGELNK